MSLKVEIWSDVVCPWCYVGKRRFEAALARFAHRDEVELVWRSFELDASAPPSPAEAGSYGERLAVKYGRSLEQAQQMLDSMTATAAEEGLDFRFDLARPGNTFDAHRLLHLALEHGRQDALKERLDRATFTEGSPSSEHAALAALAVEVGLPADEVADVLASDRYADAVRADEAQARAYGISGVPFFVVDGKYGISGAQPADVVLQALETAWAERSPLTLVAAGDAPRLRGRRLCRLTEGRPGEGRVRPGEPGADRRRGLIAASPVPMDGTKEAAMEALLSLLTRERLLAELVVFKLLELRALMQAGEGRFLGWAAEEVERATASLRDTELQRAVLAGGLAEERGLDGEASLRELLEDVGEPWHSALEEQSDKLRSLCTEAAELVAANARLAETGIQSLDALLGRVAAPAPADDLVLYGRSGRRLPADDAQPRRDDPVGARCPSPRSASARAASTRPSGPPRSPPTTSPTPTPPATPSSASPRRPRSRRRAPRACRATACAATACRSWPSTGSATSSRTCPSAPTPPPPARPTPGPTCSAASRASSAATRTAPPRP